MDTNQVFCGLVANNRDILRLADRRSDEFEERVLGFGWWRRRRRSFDHRLGGNRRRPPGCRKERPFLRGGECTDGNRPQRISTRWRQLGARSLYGSRNGQRFSGLTGIVFPSVTPVTVCPMAPFKEKEPMATIT
jgi:hypothetical protein